MRSFTESFLRLLMKVNNKHSTTPQLYKNIYNYYVMISAVAISILLTASLRLENAIKMSSANAGVIVALGLYQPSYSPFLNTGLRLIETFSGTAIALFFIFVSRIFRIRTDN